MKQEEEQNKYKKIIESRLPKKIDSKFITKYFGKLAQVRLGLRDLDEYSDALLMNGLAGIDCTQIDFSELTQEEFEKIPFDSLTVFSKKVITQFKPEEILEKGKHFGIGLENIPYTGKNIHVAIRDQNCNPYLTDANIVDYTKVEHDEISKKVNPEDIEHMHGKSTVSLLASKSCGVAKDALLHFFSGSIEEYVQYIINYNQRCKEENRENEMILVASGSWSDKDFLRHSEALRSTGCELICANNFDKHFNEFTSCGDKIDVPLEFSEDELNELISMYPERVMAIKTQAQKKDNIKIPISRTYHQVGEETNFKYQSSYSTSWGIPQIAGLFAVFKEQNRELTFEEFCDLARETSDGNLKIINPQGISRQIEENFKKRQESAKDSVDNSQTVSLTKKTITPFCKENEVINELESSKEHIEKLSKTEQEKDDFDLDYNN